MGILTVNATSKRQETKAKHLLFLFYFDPCQKNTYPLALNTALTAFSSRSEWTHTDEGAQALRLPVPSCQISPGGVAITPIRALPLLSHMPKHEEQGNSMVSNR